MPQPPPAIALLFYYVAFFLLAVVVRAVLVYRRTQINPIVVVPGKGAKGYVSRTFRVLVVWWAVVVFGLVFVPEASVWLGAYEPLQIQALVWIGWLLLIVSLLWLLAAQAQMGVSWRIGIDAERTELVQSGLFSLSRNPIYLVVRVSMLGLFFVFPSAAALALIVGGEILIQVHVRFEEEHLSAMHPESFPDYCSRVRRWL